MRSQSLPINATDFIPLILYTRARESSLPLCAYKYYVYTAYYYCVYIIYIYIYIKFHHRLSTITVTSFAASKVCIRPNARTSAARHPLYVYHPPPNTRARSKISFVLVGTKAFDLFSRAVFSIVSTPDPVRIYSTPLPQRPTPLATAGGWGVIVTKV